MAIWDDIIPASDLAVYQAAGSDAAAGWGLIRR